MPSVETGQMTAAETSVLSQQETSVLLNSAPSCSWLLQADPDHEIQDFDHVVFEKLLVCFSIKLSLQMYEEFLKVTSNMTAFLQGV